VYEQLPQLRAAAYIYVVRPWCSKADILNYPFTFTEDYRYNTFNQPNMYDQESMTVKKS
jgi:hypothetical protein